MKRFCRAVLMMSFLAPAGACDSLGIGRCDDIPGEAQSLVAAAESCEAGDACAVFPMADLVGSGSCIGAFQCSAALRADLDEASFRAAAQELVADHEGCPMCVVAGCIPPTGLTACCDAEAGRCVLDHTGDLCGAPEEQ